jgi:hypothetical protein
MPYDMASKRRKPVAYATFAGARAVARALRLNGTVFAGQNLVVRLAARGPSEGPADPLLSVNVSSRGAPL